MAKGITEQQVHAAADALVVAGERPTVERIRVHLGTGSPNTVTRLLDGWWQTLGTRLMQQRARLALPDAPADVVALAGQLWERALQQAQAQAGTAVAEERQGLQAAHAEIEAERHARQQEGEAQQAAVAAAQQAQAQAETRLSDARHLIEQQHAQVADLSQQRLGLQDRNERLERERMALADRLQQQERAAAGERETQAQHLRALEDRSRAEIDRARQETKDARARLTVLERELVSERQRLQPEQPPCSAPAPRPWRRSWPNSAICRRRCRSLWRTAGPYRDRERRHRPATLRNRRNRLRLDRRNFQLLRAIRDPSRRLDPEVTGPSSDGGAGMHLKVPSPPRTPCAI